MKSIFNRIEFHIVANDTTTIDEVFALIWRIKKDHPNARISVEVDAGSLGSYLDAP